ncbi:MAG: YoaK family protein [Clostridia bacterium]
MQKTTQMSETFRLGVILAIVGGFLDAYTFVCRGGIFANAQTGNIVLFGINLAEQNYSKAIRYIIPIFAFIIGVILAEIIKNRFKNHDKIHWRQIIIIFEITVLIFIAFLPTTENFNMIANVLVSFVCSLQVQSFRTMHGNTFATTMCTGNLRSASEHLYSGISHKNKGDLKSALQYFGIIGFFILGGTIGAILSVIFLTPAVLFACVLLIIVFILMFFDRF